MSRKNVWNLEKYKSLIRGNESLNLPSLRTLVKGFDAKDGYALPNAENWTPKQKRRIRVWYKRIELLQAQPKRIIHAKGDNLNKLHKAFHSGVPSKDLKVAFVPNTRPKLTLESSKVKPPRIRYLKSGVSVKWHDYERILVPFDQKKLALDAQAEIKRVAAQMPGAKLYFIQTGEYQSINGKSLNLVTEQVQKWMAQYDGKKPIPRSSGNYGDNPKSHHWKKWLVGLVGYVFSSNQNITAIARKIKEGRKKNDELRKKRQLYMKRKGKK